MGICGFSWRFSLLLVSGGSGCWCTSDEAGCLGLTTRKADASATPRLEKSNGPTPTGECCCCTSIILDLESVHRFTIFASLHTTFASPPPARLQYLSFLINKHTQSFLIWFPMKLSRKSFQGRWQTRLWGSFKSSKRNFGIIFKNLLLQKQRLLNNYRDYLFDDFLRKKCLFLAMYATSNVFDKILLKTTCSWTSSFQELSTLIL